MGDEEIELGGNITLAGFKDLDHAELIVVKKLVGRYARKMSDSLKDFENLTVTMKSVHKTPKSQKYEIHGKLTAGGKPKTSEVVDRNLFVALDTCLKKILAEIK
ncbi:hypothetical protein HQ533_03305 [Candidatus Woesearchaeota archaeon]|nr:hypothetical protein [Candidatus Woesearchaeota archaeon]